MGSPPPEPPIITIFGPIWNYVLDYYLITGRLFQLTANQASQFFIYLNGIIVNQSPPNVTNWSYSFPTNPDPSPTPNVVRTVVENPNGSTEHIWYWVITPTPITSAPVLSKDSPLDNLPNTIIDTPNTFPIRVIVNQCSKITLKIDGIVYGSPQNVSAPSNPVTFTIGLNYQNNPDNIGIHTVSITAENSNGTSNELTYSWNLVGLMNGLLTGNFIIDDVRKWRTRANKQSPWGAWQDANHCTLNAAINFAYTGTLTQAERDSLVNYQWKFLNTKPETDAEVYAQPYVPPGGPKGLQVFHVKRIGPTISCTDINAQGHAMLALYHGPDIDEGYRTWENWEIFQYGVRPITVGIANCNIGANYENQIPRPILPDDIVTVTMSHIDCIVVNPTTGPSLSQGAQIVMFYVHSTVNPTTNM